jgi:hypothetical protein
LAAEVFTIRNLGVSAPKASGLPGETAPRHRKFWLGNRVPLYTTTATFPRQLASDNPAFGRGCSLDFLLFAWHARLIVYGSHRVGWADVHRVASDFMSCIFTINELFSNTPQKHCAIFFFVIA